MGEDQQAAMLTEGWSQGDRGLSHMDGNYISVTVTFDIVDEVI